MHNWIPFMVQGKVARVWKLKCIQVRNKNRKKKFTLENVMCLLIAQAIMGVHNNSKENNRNATVREESA